MNRVNFYILEAKVVPCDDDSSRKNFESSVILNQGSTFDAIISGTTIKANPNIFNVYYPQYGYWYMYLFHNISHLSIEYFQENIDDEFLEFLVMGPNVLSSSQQDIFTSTNKNNLEKLRHSINYYNGYRDPNDAYPITDYVQHVKRLYQKKYRGYFLSTEFPMIDFN